MTQQGVLPTQNQVETMLKYPTPKCLRDMRGFLGLVNQATFCLGKDTRNSMEKLKDKMKSKIARSWTEANQKDFNEFKQLLVKDCEKGIYRLTSHRDSQLALKSDWSKNGSGFILYEITCKCPEKWNPDKEPTVLCCPEKWRLIKAGGRFNSAAEAGYAPIEGELLGIASALHKTRYFVSGHPDVTIITDHNPILNLLQDRTRTINNKRLTNLRRKCDGFIFQTGYGRGIDNTTDAISRIKGWSKTDPERLESVEDSKDIDDDSTEVHATEVVNRTDLDEVILEVNALNMENKLDAQNASSAILGSWYSTPKKDRIQTLLRMYGHGGWDSDNQAFSTSIQDMDSDRNRHYDSKIDVTNDLDNIYGDEHHICADNGLGHNSEAELGTGPKRDTAECLVLNINKRKYYALSWE